MDIETTVQSEVTYIWNLEKVVQMNLFVGQEERCRHRERMCGHQGAGAQGSESESCSVVSDSLRPHGLYSPWNPAGQNTGVGSLSLLQGISPTQEVNPGLLHCRQILYQLSHKDRGWDELGELNWHIHTTFPMTWLLTSGGQGIGKDPDAVKDGREKEKEGDRRWDGCMASPTQRTWTWANPRRWWWTGRPECCSPWVLEESDTTWQTNNYIVYYV